MDWTGVVEKNQGKLRRILAMLVVMAGWEMRGQFTHFSAESAKHPGPAK